MFASPPAAAVRGSAQASGEMASRMLGFFSSIISRISRPLLVDVSQYKGEVLACSPAAVDRGRAQAAGGIAAKESGSFSNHFRSISLPSFSIVSK